MCRLTHPLQCGKEGGRTRKVDGESVVREGSIRVYTFKCLRVYWSKLFYTNSIPAPLFFLDRYKPADRGKGPHDLGRMALPDGKPAKRLGGGDTAHKTKKTRFVRPLGALSAGRIFGTRNRGLLHKLRSLIFGGAYEGSTGLRSAMNRAVESMESAHQVA